MTRTDEVSGRLSVLTLNQPVAYVTAVSDPVQVCLSPVAVEVSRQK